jgi:hypothetical protein
MRRLLTPLASVVLAVGLMAPAAANERRAEARSGESRVKETGRTIGHATRDAAKAIGHATRDITREIGHAFRDLGRKLRD